MGQIIKFPIVVLTDKADETRSGITPKLESTIRQTPNALTTSLGSDKAVRNAINEIDITLSGSNLNNDLNIFNETNYISGNLKTISYNTLSGQGVISVYQTDNNLMLNTTQPGVPGSASGTIINTRTINGGIYQEASVLDYTNFMSLSSIECFHNITSGDIIGKVMIKCSEEFNNGAIQFSIGTDEDKEGIVRKFYAPVSTGLVKINYGDFMLDKVEVVEKNKTYTIPKLKATSNIKVYKYGLATLTKGQMNCVIFYDKQEKSNIHNYWGNGSDGDVVISTDTTIDVGGSGEMLVKNYNNLTINNGVTLTLLTRKGALIYVYNNFINNGTLIVKDLYSADPIAEGVSSSGLRIVRLKTGSTDVLSATDLSGCGTNAITSESNQPGISGNGKIYTIARIGCAGGPITNSSGSYPGIIGNPGTSGTNVNTNIQTGGGGAGGSGYTPSGAGGDGTCWAGGAGGGGGAGFDGIGASPGSSIGGAGGNAHLHAGHVACSSVGNPNGSASFNNSETGIGGTLILISKNLTNNGTISTKGYNCIAGISNSYTGCTGGASGGGAMLVIYNTQTNIGTTTTTGGIYIAGGWGGAAGGLGGNGSLIIDQVDL